MTRRGWPNCSTSACWVWSTMNSALIARIPATTSTTPRTMGSRRSTITSSLTATQWWSGRRHRLQRRRLPGCRTWGSTPRGGPLGRSARSAGAATESRQWQIRKNAAGALSGFVDDDLVAVLQHLFHGFQIKPLQRDVLRRFECLVDRGKTRGVALGAGDDLLAVGLRLLLDCRGRTARLRDDVVAIGLRLVTQALAIGQRTLHVAEGIDDRARRIDPLQLHLGDLDPGSIGVENPL